MTEIPGPRHVAKAAEVEICDVDGELVLLDPGTRIYLGLDEVGTHMWEALTTEPTVDDAVQLLLEGYEVEEDVLRAELEDFLGRLVEKRLVEVRPGTR